jgi:ElaB/YqjD/DUF883 family membrane-anchored ribosome-binding protein
MTELPKTDAELQALLDARANEVTESLTAKHNGEMANLRKKHDEDLRKAKEQAGKTAEEIAQERMKEQQDANEKELNELRAYKKSSEIAQKLAKEGLPEYFKNDTRLLNADEGNLDKVIKDVKKEYEQTLPKGATRSTVVQQQSQTQQPSSDDKQVAYEKMGEFLKEVVTK